MSNFKRKKRKVNKHVRKSLDSRRQKADAVQKLSDDFLRNYKIGDPIWLKLALFNERTEELAELVEALGRKYDLGSSEE